jgi:hypothetical protein
VNVEEFLGILFMMSVGAFLLYPLVKALSERIRGRPGGDPRVLEEVQALRDDLLVELEQVKGQLTDLSERMDFAERVMAKGRDRDRLPPAR